jgi:outer membrane protein insertion porin family
MKKIPLFIFIFFVIFLRLLTNIAIAQEKEGQLVTAIKVEGNETVSSSTILSKIKTKVGKPFSQAVVSEDLKRLYSLGYFSDVRIEVQDYQQGIKVIFYVVEKPVLDNILFEGNKNIKEEKLRGLMKSKLGEFLDTKQVKEDLREIEKEYQKRGFSLAKIEHDIEVDHETNRAKVYILVDEGRQVRIKKMNIEGNYAFSDKRLLKLMKTRPDTLFTSGFYKKETLDEDIKRIKAFYAQAGFIETIVTPLISYDERKAKMYLTININEGKKFLVGQINLKGNVVFPESQIKLRLKMTTGSAFSQEGLRLDVSNIQGYYFEKGYIFAQMRPSTSINPQDPGRVDITYEITENEVAYVDRIIVRGNVKTKDKVIRRELRIKPGEAFDGEKLRRSKERLYNLGYFEEVSYDTQATSLPNKRDLVVNVKEAKTGEVSFGAGYSSIDKFVGFVEVAQKNFDMANFPTFTGGGQDLRLRAEFGTVRKDYELSFTEPWIFDRPISFGFDVYQKTRSRTGVAGWGFDEQRQGGDIRLGKELSEFLRANTTYRLEKVKISDVSSEATADLRREEGENTISSLMFKLTRDTRDNIFNPSRGTVLSGAVECAGGPFGGDKDFTKLTGTASRYISVFENHVIELRLRTGLVNDFGDSDYVPIYERFYAGGATTIRGYRERRVGPRDPNSNDPLGGESMLIGNVEYSFPILEFLKGAIFYDVGNVWSKVSDFGSGGYKSGIGVGLRIKTPIGPVRLDYGYPLDKEPGREKREGRFYFSMSHAFY